jgi:hypothetical protein
MESINLIVLFAAAFFINLAYETLHSVLYATCLEAPLKIYRFLMLKGAIFDASVIVILYIISAAAGPSGILFLFLLLSLVFAWYWEWYSLKKGKWRYAPSMPMIWGVGLTPLIQLAATGLASLYIVQHFLL